MRLLLVSLLTIVLPPFAIEAGAQPDSQKLDAYFSREIGKAKIIGLQVASIGHGELVYHGSFGEKTIHSGNKVNDSTLFMMASCSKPVTALGIMKLYDRGNLDLDDDINDYLPFHIENPNYPEEKITFRMLLTHTSSLEDNWVIYDSLYTLPEGGDSPLELQLFVKDYFSRGGAFYNANENFAQEPPGSSFSYCNMGYALLGALIEQISGQPFSQYMQDEIFRPLHMHNSYWFLKDIPHDNIARPHRIEPVIEPQVLNHYGFPSFPDGQLRTTASDYAQVLKLMIARGKIDTLVFLDEATVDEFLKIQYPEVNKYQAIAWNYNEFDGFFYKVIMPRYLFMRKMPAHSGYDPGVETYVVFDPRKQRGAVILINSPIIQWRGTRIYHKMIWRLLSAAKKSG